VRTKQRLQLELQLEATVQRHVSTSGGGCLTPRAALPSWCQCAPVEPKRAVAPRMKSPQMRPLLTFCCFSGLAISVASCGVTVEMSAWLAGTPPSSSRHERAAAAADRARSWAGEGCGAAAAWTCRRGECKRARRMAGQTVQLAWTAG
jgi:hypothetical protein